MGELETIAARKKAAGAAGKKQRVGKVVRGVALGVTAAAGALARVIVPRSSVRPPAGVLGMATRLKWMRLVEESLTPDTAATLLASTASAIRKQLRNRSLYGFVVDGVWHLPKFQFHRGRVVAGLETVVPKLDRKLHPIEVVNWFTYPNSDLFADGEALSPIKWLQSGRDAELVAAVARDVGSGL